MSTFSEKFDELMKPPKFLKEYEGKDCIMCGHPTPNSRGAELLKSFFRSQVEEALREIEEMKNPHTYPDGVEMSPEYGVFEDAKYQAQSIIKKWLV